MKNFGGFLALLGIAAIVMNYLDRVPRLLMWIYNWGDNVAWGIKIGLVVVGGALYFLGPKEDEVVEEAPESSDVKEE
ncbi:hypothetical protein [Flavobacterium sp.]|uniref:hypothetical protein n=1 Tax=Flavobacterium sp. TaxID=239 RepID=UPI002622C017|nr:hypothetical protein [Flavobacterium sp.]